MGMWLEELDIWRRWFLSFSSLLHFALLLENQTYIWQKTERGNTGGHWPKGVHAIDLKACSVWSTANTERSSQSLSAHMETTTVLEIGLVSIRTKDLPVFLPLGDLFCLRGVHGQKRLDSEFVRILQKRQHCTTTFELIHSRQINGQQVKALQGMWPYKAIDTLEPDVSSDVTFLQGIDLLLCERRPVSL